MIETEISIFFWIILGAFTIGAAALATATLVNVLRLRNVRLSWAAGKMNGYPLFSTLFLGSVGIVGAAAFWYGSAEEMAVAGLYGWLGICWFTTSYLATKRFVTDNGIVKNVNEPSQTVAWHQIRDFVEKEKQYHTDYIFIYGLEDGFNTDGLIRLELSVPSSRKDAFQKLISHKLGSRIRCYVKEDIDIEEQFNKL